MDVRIQKILLSHRTRHVNLADARSNAHSRLAGGGCCSQRWRCNVGQFNGNVPESEARCPTRSNVSSSAPIILARVLYGMSKRSGSIGSTEPVGGSANRQFGDSILAPSELITGRSTAILVPWPCDRVAAPCWLLTTDFYFFDFATAALDRIALVDAEQPRTRLNDGKCDRRGRFFAGGMDDQEELAICGLWRLDHDLSITKVDGGIICSNGPCWSPDDRTFYFADTFQEEIWAYDYDIEEVIVPYCSISKTFHVTSLFSISPFPMILFSPHF